ncbi:MAG: hypothetical protein GH143_07425 [Calditrichaeota bacterium]|nr:hypothetical protein [Calditrichota bacterium]
MKDQPFDELQQVFREAQVDLPPGLKARLLAIPALEQRPAFGDLRQLLPLLALIPGFLWVVIRYASDFYGFVTQFTRGLSLPELPRITILQDFTLPDLSQILVLSELSLPVLPDITPVMVLMFTAAVAVDGALPVA